MTKYEFVLYINERKEFMQETQHTPQTTKIAYIPPSSLSEEKPRRYMSQFYFKKGNGMNMKKMKKKKKHISNFDLIWCKWF